MNAVLLSAVDSEPWSLVLFAAVLFALSSFARRKVIAAVAHNLSNVAIHPESASARSWVLAGVLTRDMPDYAVVAVVPARVVNWEADTPAGGAEQDDRSADGS